MLMRPETPRFQETRERIDKKYLHTAERRGKRNLGFAVTSLAFIGMSSVYWADVFAQESVEAASTIDIDVIGQPLSNDNDNSALIYFAGFGMKDADYIAKYQGPVTQQVVDGETWSIDYGNAPLSPEDMSEEIIEFAKERSIDHISIIGHSTGGPIGLKTASEIIDSSDLTIEFIELIAPPDGTAGLTQSSRNGLGGLDTLTHLPGAKHSSFVRFALEMGFKYNQYSHGDFLEQATRFAETANDVITKLGVKKLTSTWLMSDQALALANIDMKSELTHIAEGSSIGERPVVSVLWPEHDSVVKSSNNICEYAGKVALQCFANDVLDASHTRPDLYKPYMEVMESAAPEIRFALANELSLLATKYLDRPKHIS